MDVIWTYCGDHFTIYINTEYVVHLKLIMSSQLYLKKMTKKKFNGQVWVI